MPKGESGAYSNVRMPNGDNAILLRKPHDIKVMAGKGARNGREIDDMPRLLRDYPNSNPDEWRKESGIGYVLYDDEERVVELHWYYESKLRIIDDRKLAVQPDGSWFLDE